MQEKPAPAPADHPAPRSLQDRRSHRSPSAAPQCRTPPLPRSPRGRRGRKPGRKPPPGPPPPFPPAQRRSAPQAPGYVPRPVRAISHRSAPNSVFAFPALRAALALSDRGVSCPGRSALSLHVNYGLSHGVSVPFPIHDDRRVSKVIFPVGGKTSTQALPALPLKWKFLSLRASFYLETVGIPSKAALRNARKAPFLRSGPRGFRKGLRATFPCNKAPLTPASFPALFGTLPCKTPKRNFSSRKKKGRSS